jgi:hypothetical protein
VLTAATADPESLRRPSNVFDRAALVSDGNGYFPDPTLKSGIILLDDETQQGLRDLFLKNQRQRAVGTRAQNNLVPSIAAAAVGSMAAAAGFVWAVLDKLV